MRVIAGEFKSRRLKALSGMSTRPTPDRLRETLFSILQLTIDGSVFVDAYAGTGAVGIEALSRGAKRAVFLERNPAAVAVIRENLKSLAVGSERAQVFGGIVGTVLPKAAAGADIVFLDPPYEQAGEYEVALGWLGSHPASIVVVQHSRKLDAGDHRGHLDRYRMVRQGDNILSFYAPGNHPANRDATS
jgi:16S rRNA (guanine966-N2)-methyltransferase